MLKLYPPDPGATWPYDTWTIADNAGWLPGLYATEEAARLAFTIGNTALRELSDRICTREGEARAITLEDLESL
jgi:hypothetical protein